MLTWNTLERPLDLETLVDCSYQTPCIIFKHSTRCSISSVAKMRLERGWKLGDEQVIPYFLDLIAYRSLSDAIANRFGVQHESPQVLLIQDGCCIYHSSHLGISAGRIGEELGMAS
jgi:bacillithiol system protein YtxJ